MKKCLFLFIVLLSTFSLYAQNEGVLSNKEQKKLLKEERRRIALIEEELRFQQVEDMVISSTYVLEADRITDRFDNSRNVVSSLNYVLVDSLYCKIQVTRRYVTGGNTFNGIGKNAFGGIIAEGEINSYELNINEKKQTYTIRFNIRGFTGTYFVLMTVFHDGRAEATVSGQFYGTIRYSGNLVHPDVSKVFKGNSR